MRDSKGFKSIRNLVWQNIPEFAILTGRNGSGKSQLLLYLAHALNKATDPQLKELDELRLDVKGDSFEPGEVSYVPNSGGYIQDATLFVGNLQNVKQQAIKSLRQSGNDPNIYWRKKLRWAKQLFGSTFSSLTDDELIKSPCADDLAFMLEDENVLYGLVHVFLAYRLQTLQELEKGTPTPEIKKLLGPAPWDVLNEILAVAEFPYRVEAPIGPLLDPYQFELKESDIAVNPRDLSSGEKVILQLAVWLYNSRRHNRFPRLFLMDEPDVHLHPSMTRQFMDVIQEVLVNRYKVRVILTTHSPSTVALAPDGSIFEMSRGAPAIVPSASKANTIGLLTAGLIVVSRTTRFVIVEDESDVDFYSSVRDILSDYGPSKDPAALAPAPSIVFLPASSGQGSNKIGGGKDAVVNWVKKFDAPPFDELIRGVIDLDMGNTASDRIFTLHRYSIENYLLDPCVIFGLLVETASAPSLPGISISSGDEHLIRSLSESQLQSIVWYVRGAIEPRIQNLLEAEKSLELVEFSNGKKVQYPVWMKSRRGHDLYPLYQSAFGGAKVISPPRLIKLLQRVRLLPKELTDLMHSLQQA